MRSSSWLQTGEQGLIKKGEKCTAVGLIGNIRRAERIPWTEIFKFACNITLTFHVGVLQRIGGFARIFAGNYKIRYVM